jgi:broad-specificity NMP kinase
MRKSPNIIITGTPGVGKTSHAELLAQNTSLKHLQINKVAEEQNCYDGRDEELQTWIVDEDKVIENTQSIEFLLTTCAAPRCPRDRSTIRWLHT